MQRIAQLHQSRKFIPRVPHFAPFPGRLCIAISPKSPLGGICFNLKWIKTRIFHISVVHPGHATPHLFLTCIDVMTMDLRKHAAVLVFPSFWSHYYLLPETEVGERLS